MEGDERNHDRKWFSWLQNSAAAIQCAQILLLLQPTHCLSHMNLPVSSLDLDTTCGIEDESLEIHHTLSVDPGALTTLFSRIKRADFAQSDSSSPSERNPDRDVYGIDKV